MTATLKKHGGQKGAVEAERLLFKRPYILVITFTITTLNFLITYDLRGIGLNYFFFFIIDVLTTYIIIKFYEYGIRYMNKKLPLEVDFLKRIMYQLTLHTLAVVAFSIILNELLDHIFFKGKRLSLSYDFYTQDTVLALVFILFFHALYLGLYLLPKKDNHPNNDDLKIKVLHGMAHKLIGLDLIICIYTSLNTTYVVTDRYERYISEKTLGEFEEITSSNFFRANRQYLITQAILEAYESSANGKIKLTLITGKLNDIAEQIYVSRDKAASFRAWLNFV
ncbi:LytTR family transcriptional regulator DNA-binding domain-containing protein [uncultured Croceitalea sp.]|uniref:LytTR family DNA-binding domain-containing protein n=1 Tax=uncultured Croceitalea sp. TaxID=1798908 RepID=UPI0033068BE6